MKKMNLLCGLFLQAALCLSVLPAGAQTESLRNKMGELYDCGYTDSWFSQSLAKSIITDLYYQSLNSTINLDDIALTKEQKIWRAAQITELYANKSMRDDIIDLLTANLPESCNEQLLSDYAENKNFHKFEKYKSTTEKILTLSKNTTLQAQITATFHEPLKKFANAKIRKPKPIAAQACSESYLNAFASFWSRYEYSSLLEGIIEREIHSAATGATVSASYNTKQAGSRAYAYGVMEREARKRLDNMKEYCQENAPIFWRNQFLERGITEEDLQAVTPPLSAESLESIKQLNQYMAKHQKDNKQALLKSFGAWHTKWYNDPNENHSVLTQTPPAQTKPTEKSAESTDRVYEVAEVNPRFPGGEEALMQWLSKNIIYPPICQEQGVQGRVYTSFVINKDGSISDCEVKRSPDPAMSAEALRILSIMPPWIPGMQDGAPIRVKFSLPIMFRLS